MHHYVIRTAGTSFLYSKAGVDMENIYFLTCALKLRVRVLVWNRLANFNFYIRKIAILQYLDRRDPVTCRNF